MRNGPSWSYQWVRHSVAKYGRSGSRHLVLGSWNEPDIAYWHGTPEEYDQLYDSTADAVKRALPARASAARRPPARPREGRGLPAAVPGALRPGTMRPPEAGAPLDFISYHAKGAPDGGRRPRPHGHLEEAAEDVTKDFEIVASFPRISQACRSCSASPTRRAAPPAPPASIRRTPTATARSTPPTPPPC